MQTCAVRMGKFGSIWVTLALATLPLVLFWLATAMPATNPVHAVGS